MATYIIENTKSGVILGYYDADSQVDALEVMARCAGYRDFEQACDDYCAGLDVEIVVTKIA